MKKKIYLKHCVFFVVKKNCGKKERKGKRKLVFDFFLLLLKYINIWKEKDNFGGKLF